MRVPTYLALSYLMASSAAHADEASLSGSVGIETRTFFQSPVRAEQISGSPFSITAAPEWQWDSDDRRWTVRVSPYARIDTREDDRSHLDLREASVEYYGDDWDATVGIGSVFWGVTESRHLVNIVNQVDVLEDIDEESFLGQPMIRLGAQRDWGRLDLFVMSGFREREVKSQDARLRPFVPIVDDAGFESAAKHASVDIAARYSNVIGDWDIAVSAFQGISREPTLAPTATQGQFRPFYNQISQVGLEAQYTTGPWLWKLESIVRGGQGKTFAAAVGGFEYTFYQPWNTDADIGIITEYLLDDRGESAPLTPFDNDVFWGTRIAFNDTQDTSLLLGGVVDAENASTSVRLEAQRRVGSSTLIEVKAQFFSKIDAADPLVAFRRDDHLTIRLARFF